MGTGSPEKRRKSAPEKKGKSHIEKQKSTSQPSLQPSDEQYKVLFEFSPDAQFILNASGQILDASQTAIKRYRYSREELLRMTAKDLATPVLRSQVKQRVQEALESGAQFEWRHQNKAGEPFDVEIHARRIQYQGQVCVLSSVRDITERKLAEQKIARLTRLYATLSQINQSIVRIKEPGELYAAICKVAVRFGEFDLAWIGLLDEKTGLIDPLAVEGKHKQNQLPFEQININEAPFNKGLMAAAIHTGKVSTIDDIQTNKNMAHWHKEAVERGYHSAAAVPFRMKDKIVGVLNIYTPERGFFTVAEEISLLEETGLDISFALEAMETEVERKRAEEELLKSEKHYRGLFEDVPIAIWEEDFSSVKEYLEILKEQGIVDLRSYFETHPEEAAKCAAMVRIMDANPAALKMYRAKSKEDLLKNLKQVLSAQALSNFREEIINIADGQTSYQWEGTDRTLTGEQVEVSLSWAVAPGHENDFSKVIVSIIDITERKQAEEEIHSRSRQLAALLDASQSLTESLNLAEVLQTITEKAAKVLNLETTAIYLLENEDLYLGATTPPLPPQFPEEFRMAKLTDHPHIRETVTTGLPVVLLDTATVKLTTAERAVSEARELRTILYVPLMREKRAVGVLILGIVREPGEFSKNDIDSASSLANQAAMAVINAKLYENLENYIEKLKEQITERRQAEDALRQAEAKYHALVVQIPAVVYTDSVEHPGHTLYISPQLKTTTGYDPEEWFADDHLWLKIMHADDRERAAAESDRSIETGKQFSMEYRITTRGGQIVWIHDEAHLIRDEAGRPLYWQGILLDITERKLAEEQIRIQLARLKALHTLDIAIKTSFDLRVVLNIFLEQLDAQLKIDAAVVLLLNKKKLTLEHAASRGFRTSVVRSVRLQRGEGFAGRVVMEGKTIVIPNLPETKGDLTSALTDAGEQFFTYIGIPLTVKGETVGVLELFHRTPLGLEPDWLDFLETLADQAAIAIDNAQLFENLQRSNLELSLAYDATIEGWSHAMDLRDRETEDHTLRVTEATLELAKKMGISKQDLVHVRRGALLHDIGKLGVPDQILFKQGKLTDEEWKIMHQHPNYAFAMLKPIAYLRPALDIPYCHHEKWDGSGYPRGLKGEEIPLTARLFAIVDAWDALTSDRPYRPAWSKEKALEYIQEQAGKHFDPTVVDVFLKNFAQNDVAFD